MSRQGTVLVTGGSAVRAAIGTVVDPQDRLSFHAADLTSDAGWDAAARGCDYVLHVASPISISEPKNADELIVPARDGTRRAVGAALRAGVKRVVLTSSVAAASPGSRSPGGTRESATDEATWTDLDDPRVGAYARSKTLAERAAWDLIEAASHASAGASTATTTMATVNPSVVLGPVLSRDFSDSVQVVQRLLSGRMPGLPRLGFSFVDVRDVADLHIRAMTAPEAAGQRFIAAGDFAWFAEVAALLRANLGDAARKVPTRRVPDVVLRLVALFDRSVAGVVPRLGEKHIFLSAKAQKVLGWRPRPLEETVLDCARSLIAAERSSAG